MSLTEIEFTERPAIEGKVRLGGVKRAADWILTPIAVGTLVNFFMNAFLDSRQIDGKFSLWDLIPVGACVIAAAIKMWIEARPQ